MKTFEFRVIASDDNVPIEDILEEGIFICEAAILMNLLWLKRNPHMDCALTCGAIKYDSSNRDFVDVFQNIKTGPVLIEAGIGLCIEIVALDCAIRRFRGQDAWPFIDDRGGGIFHVMTRSRSGGRVHQSDPSMELEQEGQIVDGRLADCGC